MSNNKTIIKRRTNFTAVDNALINNPNISWRAKGLMAYFLSKPDGWNYNIQGDVVKRGREGRNAVYTAVSELVEYGYISRTRDHRGVLTYHIFENKDDNKIIDCFTEPDPQNLNEAKPDPENPHPENPDPQNPDQENGDALVRLNGSNTECSNTDVSNPHTPSDENAQKEKAPKAGYRFDDWWEHYLRKDNRARAKRSWVRDKLDDRADELIEKLKLQNEMQFKHRERKSYIPMASTYLNGEQYDDEIIDEREDSNAINQSGNQKQSRHLQFQERLIDERREQGTIDVDPDTVL